MIDVPGCRGTVRVHVELAAAPKPPRRPAARAAALLAVLAVAGILMASHAGDAAWAVIEHLAALALAALG